MTLSKAKWQKRKTKRTAKAAPKDEYKNKKRKKITMTQNNFASNPKPRVPSKLTNMSQRPRTTSEDPSREIQWDHIRTPTDAHTHTHTDAHTHVDKGVETCDFVIDTKKPLIGTLTLLMLWQISPKDPKGEGLLPQRALTCVRLALLGVGVYVVHREKCQSPINWILNEI